MTMVEIHRGSSPVVLAFPHTGTEVPEDIAARLNDEGRVLRDTDWHIHRLYDGLLKDATTVRATFHRYCIDANRDPSGESLYPGQNTTGLVPVTTFDDVPIWRDGSEPSEDDIAERVERFHRPYHEALRAEIERVRGAHGIAILYDCHSIRSQIPHLFEGVLPDFNIGTDNGRTCDPAIERAVAETCAGADGYTSVLNGRFRGGWTTRHYGEPGTGVHAIQMELAQVTHLARETPPFDLDPVRTERLRPVLKTLLSQIEALAPSLSEAPR
ncbi:N-formylglutamate deformylase [Fulvimarina endophytica]|uniref:N-formylglutamate deformylase n=1 Tax=Fulvimarina endophytica TaxID=2293836 RepID=A0A371WYY3_9HYPH|nr:N-formylglutamate deformylase [Fulvimarina endophytica]RFC62207.1 N-formylglutamate deformylase [Fulvimarina endophytica]